MVLDELSVAILDCLSAIGNLVELIDVDGRFMYCSPNLTVENIKPDELIGRRVDEVFNVTEETSISLYTLKSGIPQRDTLYQYTSRDNGLTYIWLVNTYPLILHGRTKAVLVMYRSTESVIRSLKVVEEKHPSAIPHDVKTQPVKDSRFFTFDDIICCDERMMEAIDVAKHAAETNSSVLIVGDTGTGKEMFAQSIHMSGPRRNKPFVAINCAAIPPSLMESILFGVTKGAYTGAIEKKGLFEEGADGTIFLDELQALPLEMQSKLLRVLESRLVRRVGSEKEIPIDPKIISAINMNPIAYINEGKLLPDLFYRIGVLSLKIPPLRERPKDIPLLLNYFILKYNQKFGLSIKSVSDEAMDFLTHYHWRGNVRELAHCIEHAANIIGRKETCIQTIHLPPHLNESLHHASKFKPPHSFPITRYPVGNYKSIRRAEIAKFKDQFNHTFLLNALSKYGGNITKTAQAIQISRQHLYDLIDKYHILDDLSNYRDTE